MNLYEQLAVKIIARQEAIIGPVAIEKASQIAGLELNWERQEVVISGNGTAVISELVSAYKQLFGQMSVEVCKEAVASLLNQWPADQELPEALR